MKANKDKDKIVHPCFTRWRNAIREAMEDEIEIYGYEHETLIDDANEWDNCACAEIPPEFRKFGSRFAAPDDPILECLGDKFAEQIEKMHWHSALLIIDAIEARVNELGIEPVER
jgi:hypothetical protein